MTPLLIDTDMALDDWMAILYLLKHPDCDVLAIQVAGTGEAHAMPGARNATRLQSLTGVSAVPVATGLETPLDGGRRFPGIVRFIMDRHFFVSLPRVPTPDRFPDAVENTATVLRNSKEPVTILAIGPLTNLGAALMQDPGLADAIDSIVVMGGAIDVPGNIDDMSLRAENHVAEWNIYIDPHAANIVFQCGAPVTLIPLDVTRTVPLTKEFLARFCEMPQNPAMDFLYRGLRRMLRLAKTGFYFWDPLAAFVAIQPEHATFIEHTIRVVELDGAEYGRTVACSDGSAVSVCTSVDLTALETSLIETLSI